MFYVDKKVILLFTFLISKSLCNESIISLNIEDSLDKTIDNANSNTLVVHLNKDSISPELLSKLVSSTNIIFADMPELPDFINRNTLKKSKNSYDTKFDSTIHNIDSIYHNQLKTIMEDLLQDTKEEGNKQKEFDKEEKEEEEEEDSDNKQNGENKDNQLKKVGKKNSDSERGVGDNYEDEKASDFDQESTDNKNNNKNDDKNETSDNVTFNNKMRKNMQEHGNQNHSKTSTTIEAKSTTLPKTNNVSNTTGSNHSVSGSTRVESDFMWILCFLIVYLCVLPILNFK
ncbi:hypothetical protein TPHA_0G01820 [Tetrapisispora phaffii CBS 4417]|uniref:Uncharacterized protein n=1 Tax=Tetrapisispora phaffii (strain ATCC 24235 / CBS 4417 / NBRC 1672 / NRRL Y-8282 / UCD 70-5) TaxID=1071381 RepID=G8BVU0_TETPH|nr:hypothetical protein TPHA_0G01820 [Tetrapisispora phaffii CBS 4417]CCE64018.1 hypothetical protein TPHA_0G01820 [Tetrapisispora phaffii CBS 4417]